MASPLLLIQFLYEIFCSKIAEDVIFVGNKLIKIMVGLGRIEESQYFVKFKKIYLWVIATLFYQLFCLEKKILFLV